MAKHDGFCARMNYDVYTKYCIGTVFPFLIIYMSLPPEINRLVKRDTNTVYSNITYG